jgi:hypothetical protein
MDTLEPDGEVPPVEVTALAVDVTIPGHLRWTDERRGVTFALTTITVRLLPDGRLAAKAYGRPLGAGRGAYVSFAVPDRSELAVLVSDAAARRGALGSARRRGLTSLWVFSSRQCNISVVQCSGVH